MEHQSHFCPQGICLYHATHLVQRGKKSRPRVSQAWAVSQESLHILNCDHKGYTTSSKINHWFPRPDRSPALAEEKLNRKIIRDPFCHRKALKWICTWVSQGTWFEIVSSCECVLAAGKIKSRASLVEGTFLLGFKEPHKSETHTQSRMTRDTGNKTTLIRKSIKIDSRNRCAQTSDTVIIKKRYQNSSV